MTKIEWCSTPQADGSLQDGRVWNPFRGCQRVSPGCGDGSPGPGGGCYAERQAARFSGPGQPYEGLVELGKNGPRWTGKTRFVAEKLAEPLSWSKPSRVFVNSMSDAFYEAFTNEEIAATFGVMAMATRHTFLVLTKRADRMLKWFEWLGRVSAEWDQSPDFYVQREAMKFGVKPVLHKIKGTLKAYPWPLPNVHLGVSVETQKYAGERIPLLLRCPAAVHWVSAEPLLGPLDLSTWLRPASHVVDGAERVGDTWHRRAHLRWIVAGGESGPRARPSPIERIRFLVKQCREAGTACFVKQLGAYATLNGVEWPLKHPKGGLMAEWPEDIRIRELV